MNDVLLSANASLRDALYDLNVRQEKKFIRFLLQYDAYEAILTFLKHYSSPSVFVYTAAIKALAQSGSYRRYCFTLLNEMDRLEITPSAYTLAALFQACDDCDETAQLAGRVRESFPCVVWTAPVWESAIYACAPADDRAGGTAIALAEGFYFDMLSKIGPTERGILAVLHVYAASRGAASKATDLLNSLLLSDAHHVTTRVWGAILEVCAAAKDHVSSLEVLKIMTKRGIHPNVRHCTSFLKAAASAGDNGRAIAFLYYMAGVSDDGREKFDNIKVALPDMVAIRTVLFACSNTWSYGEARKLLSDLGKGLFGDDIRPNEEIYNLVLDACSNPEEAKALIREMRLSRRSRVGAVPPSKLTYTKAIKVCRKARDVESARFLLDLATNDGITPDVFMYSAAIWTAARASDVNAALHFRSAMEQSGCFPNIVTMNGIIVAFLSKGNIPAAIAVYEEIFDKGLTPTIATYEQLTTAAESMTNDTDKLILLDRIYRSMRDECRCIEIGGPVLEAIIIAHGSQGRYSEARDVFESIYGPPDRACLRAILNACSKAVPPAWEDALIFLNSVEPITQGSVDQSALAFAMLACSKANKWSEALELLRLHGNSRTSVAAVNALIAACGRNGRPDMSMEVLNGMPQLGLHPDRYSYRNAIIACNQAAHSERRLSVSRGLQIDKNTVTFEWWEGALSLLRRMKEDGLRPDIQTYSSAISACEAAGEWQLALGVLQSMMDEPDEEELNIYCFNAAIAACEKAGAWVEALDIYMRMQRITSLRPTTVTYGSLILALDKAGQKELATSIYEEGRHNRVVANPWRMTRSGGRAIRAIDLHSYSSATAKAAIRSYFESLTSRSNSPLEHDLVLITGKGLRSENEPVLMPVALDLLETEYGIRGRVDPDNVGRIVVDAETLSGFVAKRQ